MLDSRNVVLRVCWRSTLTGDNELKGIKHDIYPDTCEKRSVKISCRKSPSFPVRVFQMVERRIDWRLCGTDQTKTLPRQQATVSRTPSTSMVTPTLEPVLLTASERRSGLETE